MAFWAACAGLEAAATKAARNKRATEAPAKVSLRPRTRTDEEKGWDKGDRRRGCEAKEWEKVIVVRGGISPLDTQKGL
jgi:hypothetical protein